IQPSAAANGLAAGGVAVVWESGADVFAQLLGVDGTPIGAEFRVNTETASTQDQPVAAGLNGGRFVVVWTSADSGTAGDGSGSGVFAQVYEGDGTAVGVEFQVNVETSSTQEAPTVTATGDGGFVVAWASANSGGAGDGSGQGVIARRFDDDGAAISGEVVVNEQISSTQFSPSVAPIGVDDYVVVWQSTTSGAAGDGSGEGIFQRLLGDAASFTPLQASPVIEAVSSARTFDEATVNAAPQRLDVDAAAAVSDADSTDFDGGRLSVGRIAQTLDETGFPAQDAAEQHQIGLDLSGAVTVAGATVSVGGVAVGTIASDGADGADLVIDLNAAATAARVEALIENLTYANASDDPQPGLTLAIRLEDGDGGGSDAVLVEIAIAPEADIDGTVRGEIRVNTFTTGSQADPRAASTFDSVTGEIDGYVVVWTSGGQDQPGSGNTGVYGQRYDADGAPLGDEFRINSSLPNNQEDPSVAGLTGGGFVAVWTDNTLDGSGRGIFATRYDAAGVAVPGQTEFQVNTETSSTQSQPRVVGLSDGGYQVTWTSATSGSAGDGDSNGIFTQRYDATGSAVGGERQVNAETAGGQDVSDVAALAGGRAVVVWVSDTDGTAGDGSNEGVFARFLDDQGVPDGDEFQVNAFTIGEQNDPQVAALASGDFVVIWRSAQQDGASGGIYGQMFTAAGVALGSEFRVND
ncbi:MAG: hypothetical protein AAFU61_13110, partial [Pseudomonadota bacterium]